MTLMGDFYNLRCEVDHLKARLAEAERPLVQVGWRCPDGVIVPNWMLASRKDAADWQPVYVLKTEPIT